MDRLLECENLSVSFDGRKILDNVSFFVEERDFLCIVGENGTGKTTLTNAILGLVPISGGSIRLNGISKSDIGYLPQKLKAESGFPASVSEIVLSGFVGKSFFRPFYSRMQRCKAEDSMKLLSVYELRRRSFSELSGGQQQRVLLARAVCASEKLVMLDEPVTGLDAASSDGFYKLIVHLNTDHGMAVIMVSHDIRRAVKYCGKVLHLGHGVQFFGSSGEYAKTELYARYAKAEGE